MSPDCGLNAKVRSLKKKLDEVTKDNGDLLCAVKYLKSKMEQKDASSRCATPTVESSRSASFGRDLHPLSLTSSDAVETRALRDKCSALERENARLRQRATSEGYFHCARTLKKAMTHGSEIAAKIGDGKSAPILTCFLCTCVMCHVFF